MAIFSAGVAIMFGLFYAAAMAKCSVPMLCIADAMTGFFVGIVGVIPALIVRVFPAEIRFSGVSFSYNVAYAIFGGATPILLTMAISKVVLAPVMYISALGVMGIAIGALISWQGFGAIFGCYCIFDC